MAFRSTESPKKYCKIWNKMKERYKHKLKNYKMEIQDLNEEFENQRQSYHADLRDQQLQIDLLTGTTGTVQRTGILAPA